MILLLVMVVAYLPISSFQFFVKNDAFTGYFPPKFFMSESLHAGYFPFWNPYINYGFPQYGDMSGGFWSPITWLIAATVGYDAYTLTIELLFYIVLGGWGMYQLCRLYKLDQAISLIAGCSYMCCGYMVGHLQHFNWISAAAFLPWCCWAYFLLLNHFNWRNLSIAALLFYLFVASAHPGLIISAIYFFSFWALYIIWGIYRKSIHSVSIAKVVQSNMLLVIAIVLLSAGMIAGYVDIFPFFLRSEKLSLTDALSHPTNIQSWTSVLLPFSTVKNDFYYATDPSMRNSYFGLTFLLFFIVSIFQKKKFEDWFWLISGIGFALLASGGIFKTIAYKCIPFIGYVRLNGEFRLFALLSFILLSAKQLQVFFNEHQKFSGSIKSIYYIIKILLFLAIIGGLYFSIHTEQSIIYRTASVLKETGIVLKLKAIIDAISFYDTFWIQGTFQLLLIWGIKYCLLHQQKNLLVKIVLADLVIASLLNIPFTGAGKAPVSNIQEIFNQSPKGIPLPTLQPIVLNDTGTAIQNAKAGSWTMYSKQIGAVKEVPYPIILHSMRTYFDAIPQQDSLGYIHQPFLYLENNSIEKIKLNEFSPTALQIEALSATPTLLVFQQTYYPHWKYTVNGNTQAMEKEGINFMKVPLAAGSNNVQLTFDVRWLWKYIYISLSTLLILLFLLIKGNCFNKKRY